jgi:DNA polymerase III subunit alpha
MNADFSHLHVHSQFSLLDGALRFDELFEFAHQDKMEAVALTDHGNMFGVLDFYNKAKEFGIKPIIGCEMYIAPGNRTQKGTTSGTDDELPPYATARSGLSHLVLLCMNEEGYQNLCKLVSIGYLEGFYYRPRIDKEVLAQYSGGLIATSACLKGEVNQLALLGDMDRAKAAAQWYQKVFPDRFYLEMQASGLPQQMMLNQRFAQLSKDLGIPLVGTADAHYLKKEDAISQEVLMAIQTGKTLDDSGSSIKSDEFYFKPQAQMVEDFRFCPEAVANTREIAKRCNFEFKFNDEKGKKIYHFPKFDPPPGMTADQHLEQWTREGLVDRIAEYEERHSRKLTPEELKKYEDRLVVELKVIIDMGFTGYFLIVADFIRHAKNHGIPVGPGRGSGAGSLIAYCLKITDLDPLEHGLIFERFLNPERISLPDFDVDFCMDKRDQIIQYVSEKYGKDSVAQIITFGKLQARGVIRDVGRVFGIPAPEVDKMSKLVPETLNITLEEAFAQEPRLRQLTEKDPRMARLFQICRNLEGLARHASIHAAGLVISNRPMVEHCALYRGKNNELVIQFDMNNADRIGLIKFDFLGLKTLTFLQRAEELIQAGHPEDKFSVNKIRLDDKPMYEMLAKGDTLGVFQLESSGMQDLMKKIRPDCFEDIVASNALYRPGPLESGMVDDFIARKHGQVAVKYDFEELRPVLEETYGVIVYQEQVQQIAMRLASYTAGGADLLRRAMGKKKPEEMAKQKAIFVEGATKNKFNKEKIEFVFDLMAKFAGYGFNKSHAAAYSLITCQTAYIKCHYPVEFFAALLSIERENTDKITKYIADAQRRGIAVLPPDINESNTDFTVLPGNQIRFGLGAIKGVGQLAIDSILEARKEGGPFQDLFDLCSRANTRTANKRVLEAFVKAGALDSFKIHRASLFKAIDDALSMGSDAQKTRDSNQNSFADLFGDDTADAFESRKVTYPDEKPWERLQELKYEKETIGIFVTGHPLDGFKRELNRYTTKTIEQCQTGKSGTDVYIGVEVSSLREFISRRGDRMAFATLEDQHGQIDAVIFSDIYLESEEVLKSQEPIWIKGQLEISEGTPKLILSKKSNSRILPLRYAYESLAREVHMRIDVEANEAAFASTQLEKLQQYLEQNHSKEGAPFYVHLQFPNRSYTTLRMKHSIPIKREVVSTLPDLLSGCKVSVDFS